MKIKWEMTGDDPNDLKAIVPEGMLRVERMGRANFWWCVYFNDVDYHSEDKFGLSLYQAKVRCANRYRKLLKASNEKN